MPSFWSVLQFVKTFLFALKYRRDNKVLIVAMAEVINHDFICYDFDELLKLAETDKKLKDMLEKSNICD